MYVVRQASRRSWRIGQTRPVKVVFMSYRNTLQADALKLVAKKMQSSLAVEGELPEDGLAAYGDDGDDMMMALARRIVSGGEEDTETMEEVFAQARNAESEAEELLVDDGWKVVEIEPETIAVNGNGNGNGHHDDLFGPTVELVPANGRTSTATGTATTTRPRSRSSRCSPGRSSWPRSRSSPGAARPRPRHCPCSSGRWNRSERKSRSTRAARPQHAGGGSRRRSDCLPLASMYGAFFAFLELAIAAPPKVDEEITRPPVRGQCLSLRPWLPCLGYPTT